MKASGSVEFEIFGLKIGKAMLIPMIIALPALLIYGVFWVLFKAIRSTFKLIRR